MTWRPHAFSLTLPADTLRLPRVTCRSEWFIPCRSFDLFFELTRCTVLVYWEDAQRSTSGGANGVMEVEEQ